MPDGTQTAELLPADMELIEIAHGIIRQRYKPGWHVMGAALRTKSGRIFTGVHLEAYVGGIAICAEAVALGRAATEAGETDVETIAAVRHSGLAQPATIIDVAAPCGMCREMISDYSPNAVVILPTSTGRLARKPISQLLPEKYLRH
jgi:cytidine deaminase